jgi:HEPN domain-containing protein
MLAEERIAEAQTLVAGNHFSGAYYLAGCAVELGLKAVLTRSLASHAMPDLSVVKAAYTHDLIGLA